MNLLTDLSSRINPLCTRYFRELLSHPASISLRHCSNVATPNLAMKMLKKIVKNLTYLTVLLLINRVSKRLKISGRYASRRAFSSCFEHTRRTNETRNGYSEFAYDSVLEGRLRYIGLRSFPNSLWRGRQGKARYKLTKPCGDDTRRAKSCEAIAEM